MNSADALCPCVQSPDVDAIDTTNAPDGGVGSLGYSASQCSEQYGRAPSFLLVDFFVSFTTPVYLVMLVEFADANVE